MSIHVKLRQNKERREYEQFIESIPSDLRMMFENCETQYSSDFFSEFFHSPYPEFKDGKLITKQFFKTYIHCEYDLLGQVEQHLQDSQFSFSIGSKLYLGRGMAIVLDSEYDQDLVIKLLPLREKSIINSILISNHEQGLIIGNYCGYLTNRPPSPNNDEIVYEVTYYQPKMSNKALHLTSDQFRS